MMPLLSIRPGAAGASPAAQVLDALGIHKVVLRHLADAELYIRESQRSAEVLKQPVAVVIPPHVMAEDSPSV